MRIYRVENEAGTGPYTNSWIDDPILGDMFKKHNEDLDQFPNDERDFDIYLDRSLYFGFDSVAAAIRWFGGHFDDLHRAGYDVSEYEVDDNLVLVGRSGKQVVFPLGDAEWIRSMPMKKLLDFI